LFTSPPNFSPSEDPADKDEDATTNLGDDSHVQVLLVGIITFSNYMFVIAVTIYSIVVYSCKATGAFIIM